MKNKIKLYSFKLKKNVFIDCLIDYPRVSLCIPGKLLKGCWFC